MSNDIDLSITGYCVSFDQPSEDGRPPEERASYEVLADFCEEIPLWVGHFPLITSSGFRAVGRVINFAVIDGEHWNIPSGVLAYAELTRDWVGVSVFAAISSGQLWALSLGGNGKREVSLADQPAFRTNRILGWGPAARKVWDLLVPGVAPDPADHGAGARP